MPELMPMLLSVGDTISTLEQPIPPSISKLCRTGQAASKTPRDLSEIMTSVRLSCSRTGKCSPPPSPYRKQKPPKLATRRVDEKRCTDAGSDGGGK